MNDIDPHPVPIETARQWESTPVRWAVTAAGIGIVVTLVAAPHATGYAAAAGVALVVLVLGVEWFIRELRAGQTDPAADHATTTGPTRRCCVCGGPNTVYENCYGNWFCWDCADCPCNQTPCIRTGINDPAVSAGRPDVSGQDPDPTRTDPDTTGQHGADQGGHDPDALRMRLGGAIREYLRAHTLPALVDLNGRELAPSFGASEYDIAAVAIAELAPELARAERAEAEAARWLAFIERGLDTHMSFGVINPDGTTEQLPCADWCHACRVERAEAALVLARQAHLRLTAYLAGFADVLDASDRGPWANTAGAALADLERALAEPTDGSSQ